MKTARIIAALAASIISFSAYAAPASGEVTEPVAAVAQATPAPDTTKPATGAPKPRAPRSEKELANDNRMRACGAEWKAQKAELTAKGETWRKFNGPCRAKLKAEGK